MIQTPISELKILDCTIRDGGFYTNWNFTPEFLSEYLNLSEKNKIDIVELGYLNLESNDSNNINFKNIPDSLNQEYFDIINSFDLNYSLMIDSWRIVSEDHEYTFKKILNSIRKCPFDVKLIRIATLIDDIPSISWIIDSLQSENIDVAINIMQMDSICIKLLERYLDQLNKTKLKYLYLADSFGNMNPFRTFDIFSRVKNMSKAMLGFHAHDNCGLALVNSYAAISAGVQIIDATLKGLGRGAGNVQTESIVLIKNFNSQNTDFEYFIAKHLEPLKHELQWGCSTAYMIQAKSKVHPLYIQKIYENSQFDCLDRLKFIEALSAKENLNKFDVIKFQEAINEYLQ